MIHTWHIFGVKLKVTRVNEKGLLLKLRMKIVDGVSIVCWALVIVQRECLYKQNAYITKQALLSISLYT